nr:cytochrome P450 [Tanacetum cinerariifolium]
MEYSTLLLALSFLVTLIYGFSISNRRHSRLPPGPYPLPIIGNILALGDKPHRSLTQLSTRYGPLMSLKLGMVSSREMAKEFFVTHDKAFSNRSIPNIAKLMDHHAYSITWLPTGDEWRKQRRITKEYLLSGPSLEGSEQLRSEKVQELVDNISECCTSEKAVNIGAIAFTTSLNMLFNVSSTKDDVLDLLLNLHLQEKSEFSPNDIKHLLFDLIIAGTDTSSTTMEWAMTELIQVGGFVVPKDAQIICNVWAIGRDPKVWSDPEKFMPERFLGVEIDYRGQNFELIPFGGGRRMCPGLNIAHRMLHLMLSSFIYNFDWKLEGNLRVEDLDMSEKFGLALPRNVPLMLVPTKL